MWYIMTDICVCYVVATMESYNDYSWNDGIQNSMRPMALAISWSSKLPHMRIGLKNGECSILLLMEPVNFVYITLVSGSRIVL